MTDAHIQPPVILAVVQAHHVYNYCQAVVYCKVCSLQLDKSRRCPLKDSYTNLDLSRHEEHGSGGTNCGHVECLGVIDDICYSIDALLWESKDHEGGVQTVALHTLAQHECNRFCCAWTDDSRPSLVGLSALSAATQGSDVHLATGKQSKYKLASTE
jgi:hypothetical protein